MRWRRRIEELDPVRDHEEIYRISAGHEFPWDYTRALEKLGVELEDKARDPEHELFTPVHELESASMELMERRDEARRLVLPDGIGEDIRVLLQARGVPLQ